VGGRAIDKAARRAAEVLILDYAHAIDDGDLAAWPGFFTEECRYRIVSRESRAAGLPIGVMHCQGRGMLVDRVEAIRRANIFEPHAYCHLHGPTRLSPGADAAEGIAARTNFQVVRTMHDGGMEVFAAGKYLDRIVWEEDGPRFAEREVVIDSRRIDVLLVYPL
jgi:anthranilate 1,2-dioxygenase small subunit